MELTTSHLIAIFVAGLFFSAIFSMTEAAIISQDRHRLSHLAESGNRSARLMQKMMEQLDSLLAAILLFNNIANVMCATAAAVMATRLSGGGEAIAFVVSLGVAFLILVLSEISPKIIGVRHSTHIALLAARPLRVLLTVFYPAVAVANFFAGGILALVGIRGAGGWRTVMNVSELQSAVRESNRIAREAKDDLRGRHYHMVEQMLRLGGMPVEKIMTPRRQIQGINLQDGDDMLRVLMETEHAKLPLYDGNIDSGEGFVNTLQALRMAREGAIDAASLRQIKTPPIFVPAAADALQQMETMRRQDARMAFVVDGAGRVVGLLTFSNFSEAVIGGESSSYDVRYGSEGEIILPGDFPLREMGLYHLPVPETSASSISGLVVEALGGIPEQRVCLRMGDLRLEIEEIDKTAVRWVKVYPPVS